MTELKKMRLIYDDQTEKELEAGAAICFEDDGISIEFVGGANQMQLFRLGYGIIAAIERMGLADKMEASIRAGAMDVKEMNAGLKREGSRD